jgi:large subunit ribosomal protein L25
MVTRIKASPVQARTKGELKRLRKNGIIPISLQHRGDETRHYQMPLKPLMEFMRQHGEAAIVELDLGSESPESALIHDIHRDAVTHLPVQVTFMRVLRNEPVKTNVPLVAEGEPESVRNGETVLQLALNAVEVRCLPANLPESLSIDVSNMAFGDILHVSDIKHSDKVEILTPPDAVVASLSSLLRKSGEEEEAAAEPAAEEAVEERAEAA